MRDALGEGGDDDLPVNALMIGETRDALVEAGDDDLQVNALMIGGSGGRGAEIHWWRVGISTTLIFFFNLKKKMTTLKKMFTTGIRNHRILLL